MDDTPRQFIDELKFAILGRRIGQIALAVVLAEECIRLLNALVWYLIVPLIANLLHGNSESLLFASHRNFPWLQLIGSFLEFVTTIVFVFYANRLIHGRNRPRRNDEVEEAGQPSDDYEPIVPRMFSAPEAPRADESSR
jgi:large-conductance mechanosensitive channel